MVYESSYPDYLEHYGVKGMKWGVIRSARELLSARKKNGVSAVSSSKTSSKNKKLVSSKVKATKKSKTNKETKEKKKQEDKIVDKDKILNSRDAKLIYANRGLFTTKELNDAYSRLVLESNFKKLVPEEKSAAKKAMEFYIDKTKTVTELVNTTKNLYDSYSSIKRIFDESQKKK